MLGAVILTGDFSKGAECEASSGDCGDRRISPLEAAISCYCVLWRTSDVYFTMGPGGECFGFVVLPESQNRCLILRHGSISVVLLSIGLKTTDQTWHYEQWPHLKFAGRKRRRNVSLADSKSRQKR